MKKVVKVSLICAGTLTLLAITAAAYLYRAGQDTSDPPEVKVPPPRTAPTITGDIDLSPAKWDAAKRVALFERNARMGDADAMAVGSHGAIAATTGAPAVHAGLTALENGGNAIDAVLSTSLAQISLAMGCWVSYAGIFELVYYDAKSGQVYNLNAGYNSVLGESDPSSIPFGTDADGNPTPSGRTALVPGYFAGVQAAHEKFGRLPFESLFEPAVSIAEEGMRVTSYQESLIDYRKDVLSRLPETRAVFGKADGSFYRAGDLLKQTALTATLKAVAKQGADYIYQGPWAAKFVEAVQDDGGKITLEDMARYEVIWPQPLEYDFGDYSLHMTGRPGQGGTHLAEALNLARVSGLAEMGDYRASPEAFFWFTQFTHAADISHVPRFARGALFFGRTSSGAWPSGVRWIRECKTAQQRTMRARYGTRCLGEIFDSRPLQKRSRSTRMQLSSWISGATSRPSLTPSTRTHGVPQAFLSTASRYLIQLRSTSVLAALEPGSRLPNPVEPLIMFKNGKPIGAAFSHVHWQEARCSSGWIRECKTAQQRTMRARYGIPKHSDAIVVMDKWGNIAAVTHSINAYAWGTTGIFVDGVSIPDSASFYQSVLAALEPGSRLPNPVEPLIMFKNGKPIGAFSSIGEGLHQKMFAVLYNIMAHDASLEEAMSAPSTHFPAFDSEESLKQPTVQVVEGEFAAELLEQARAMGLDVKEFPNTFEAVSGRGFVVGVMVNRNGDYEAVAPRMLNAPAEALLWDPASRFVSE